MIYGITGKIASGKNYVASLIELKEHVVIDLDQMAKDSYAVLADQIKAEFGTTDRQELSKIVFADSQKRRALESIIYPHLRSEIKKMAKANNIPVFINGALLRRSGLDKICECVIYVDASERLRYIRARRRSGMTREDFAIRDKAQKDVDYTKFEYHCPVEVIINERNTHVRSELNAILKKYGLRTRRPRLFSKETKEVEEIEEVIQEPVVEKEPEVKPVKEKKPTIEKAPKAVEKDVKKEESKKEPEAKKEAPKVVEKEIKKEEPKTTVKEVKIEPATPVLSNEDMYIFPESVSPQTEKKEKKNKSKKKHPGLVILIILLLLGGGAFCFFRYINPSSLDYIQSKTSSPFELPKISSLLENLSKKKDLKSVELPPEVQAPKVEKVQETVTEVVKETPVEVPQEVQETAEKTVEPVVEIILDTVEEPAAEAVEEPVEETVEEVAEEPVVIPVIIPVAEPVAETVAVEPAVESASEPVVETVTAEPVEEVTPEVVEEVVSEPVAETPVNVKPVATNRTELHTYAYEELPGDLKFILMTL